MTKTTVLGKHAEFLTLVPALEARARQRFRYRTQVDVEEAVADVLAYGFASYLRLKNRGKSPTLFPATFVQFAVLAVSTGRGIGRRLTSKDAMAATSQRRHGFSVYRFDDRMPSGDAWWRDLIADRRARVSDQAVFNLDFPVWLNSLAPAKARVAHLLADGYSTDAAARLAGVSPGRVSQLRRELASSWSAFSGGI